MSDFNYASEVIGKNGISARVVAKSKSAYSDTIITTWEYDAPKCILAELNTHCMLVRNAQSSRAVPIKKVLEQIRKNPVTPVHWGSNQAGMVAGEEINNSVVFQEPDFNFENWTNVDYERGDAWKHTAKVVSDLQEAWENAGYHKQIVNRIGEAFTMVKGVITGTEIDNFFHLRYHKDADPYIRELAKCMWEAYELVEAEVLYEGEWHTPYVPHTRTCMGDLIYLKEEFKFKNDGKTYPLSNVSLEEALKISAAACGQVSYRKLDLSEDTVDRVWDRLMNGDIVHASVTGHQATPMNSLAKNESDTVEYLTETKGVTHLDENFNLWSAQFKDWIMHRKIIPNESFKGKFVPPNNDSES